MPPYVPRSVIDAQEESDANGLSTLLSTITDEIKRLATDENIAAIQALAGSSGKLDTLMNMLGNLDANVTMVANDQPASATVDGNGVIQIEIPSPLDGTDGEQGYTPAYDFFVESNGDLYYKYIGTIQNADGAGKIENINTIVHNYIDSYAEIFTYENKIKLLGIEEGATADQTMADIPVPTVIGTAPHVDNLEGVLYHMYSAGVMDGGDITDNLDGTADVAVSQALLRATGTTSHDALIACEIPASIGLTFTDNSVNIIYADHNNGTPALTVTTDPTVIDMLSKVPLYYLVREGTVLHIIDVRNQNVDHIGRNQLREFYTAKFIRKNGGAIIQDGGTLHLQCSAGAFYFQLNEYPLPALDTTSADTFELYYRDGIGGWNESNVQVAPVLQYDDGSGTLVTLSNNKYGVHWVYGLLGNNPHYAVVYSQAEYANIAEAQASSEPTELPPSVSGVGVLLGRLVFEKGDTELTAVETVFSTSFVSPFAVNHENLDGLQGGTLGEHNHLTNTEYALITNAGGANGVATLDGAGIINTAQLPSYVDDVIESATYAALPVTGEIGKIYVVVADETQGGDTSSYRWTGSVYALVSNTLTAADIKALYESNADTNEYSDAEQTKLAGIEDNATADQTATEIETLYEGLSNTNKYTDVEKAKVGNISITVPTDLDTVGSDSLNTTATTLTGAINEVHGEVDAHLADTTDAHDASAISNVAAGNIVATDVQSAINELDTDKAKLAGDSTQAFAVNSPSTDNDAINRGYFSTNYLGGFKNKIINGNFDIWQRATSQTSSSYGSDDRFLNTNLGSAKVHSQQSFTIGQTDVPNNPIYFSRTVVTSSAGAGNAVLKQQNIEDVRLSSGETFTLSFWAKADSAKNIAVEFAQRFGSGGSAEVNSIEVTTINLTTAWQKFEVTVTFPSISGKTVETGSSYAVNWWFEAGSTFDARTNTLGQQSGTFDIAQVQFEKGSQATAFEQRPIGLEQYLCERYFRRLEHRQSICAPHNAGNGYAGVFFESPMRAAPAIVLYRNDWTTPGELTWNNSGATVANFASLTSNVTKYGCFVYSIVLDSTRDAVDIYFTADAELQG